MQLQIQFFSHFSRTTIRAPNQTIFIAFQASLDSVCFLIKHLPTPIAVHAWRESDIVAAIAAEAEPKFLNRKPFEQFRQLADFKQVLDRQLLWYASLWWKPEAKSLGSCCSCSPPITRSVVLSCTPSRAIHLAHRPKPKTLKISSSSSSNPHRSAKSHAS